MAVDFVKFTEQCKLRAKSEKLRAYFYGWGKEPGVRYYRVRSRSQSNSVWHDLDVLQDEVVSCTCEGFSRRSMCTHAGAVMRRLEREAKRAHRPVVQPELRLVK